MVQQTEAGSIVEFNEIVVSAEKKKNILNSYTFNLQTSILGPV